MSDTDFAEHGACWSTCGHLLEHVLTPSRVLQRRRAYVPARYPSPTRTFRAGPGSLTACPCYTPQDIAVAEARGCQLALRLLAALRDGAAPGDDPCPDSDDPDRPSRSRPGARCRPGRTGRGGASGGRACSARPLRGLSP